MAVLLIAEDDDDVCLALTRLFTRAGFEVLTAPDGASALRLAETQQPDVILTDLDMPALTGLQLCQAVRRHPELQDVPVAILSGSLQPGDPRTAGANLCGVFLKPYGSSDLVAAVQRLAGMGRHGHATPCSEPAEADRQPSDAGVCAGQQ